MPRGSDADSPAAAPSQLPGAAKPQTLVLLQVLRAIAALLVVAHHATILVEERLHYRPAVWTQGAAGVDIFFVISGLVMVLSTRSLPPGRNAALTFARKRLQRIVPLYWLVTTIKLAGLLAAPGLAFNAIGTRWHILASYLFLPSIGPTGTLEPLVVVGWTLNLEMLFYALFALALLLRLRPWIVVIPVLLALVCCRLFPLAFGPLLWAWSDPIVAEFGLGILLGGVLARTRTIAPAFCVACVLAGPLLIQFTPHGMVSPLRPLVWGLPATAIVIAAVGLEPHLRTRVPRSVVALGDASYSIYLTHGFLLPLIGMSIIALHLERRAALSAAVGGALLLSSVAGWLSYRIIEQPIMRWFRVRRAGSPFQSGSLAA